MRFQVLLSCIIFVFGLLPSAHSLFAQNRTPKIANICPFLLKSVATSAFDMVINDPRVIVMSILKKRELECAAREACQSDLEVFSEFAEALAWSGTLPNIRASALYGNSNKLIYSLPGFNSTSRQSDAYTPQELRQYFAAQIPRRHQEAATAIFDLFRNSRAIRIWIQDLRKDVLRRMWQDGIRRKIEFKNRQLTASYLDQEMAIRGRNLGFSVHSSDRPWGIYTFSQFIFNLNLSQARLFVDWNGQLELRSGFEDGKEGLHGSRGHLLQMIFVAEHVPKAIELIKFIGRTNDFHNIWLFLFDNTANYDTAFYSGFWMNSFSDYLNIPFP